MGNEFSRRHFLWGGGAALTAIYTPSLFAQASTINSLSAYPYSKIDFNRPGWPKTDEQSGNILLDKSGAERLGDRLFNYYFLDNQDFLNHLHKKYGIDTSGNFAKDAKEVMWGHKLYMRLARKKGFYRTVGDELDNPPEWNKTLGISGFHAGDVHAEVLQHIASYVWEVRLRIECARLHGVSPIGIYEHEKYEFCRKILGGPDNPGQPDRWGGPTPKGLVEILDPTNENQIRDAAHRCPIPNFLELFTDLQSPNSPIKITNILALNAKDLVAVQSALKQAPTPQ